MLILSEIIWRVSSLGKMQELAFILLYSPVSLPYLGIANPSKI